MRNTSESGKGLSRTALSRPRRLKSFPATLSLSGAASADGGRFVLRPHIAAADGYVSLTHFLNSNPAIRPTIDLFVNFDQPAIGSDPLADAAKLTEQVLAGEDTVDVPALHAASGLSLRRFNAAITLVIAEVDDRRVSQEISSEYPSRWFMLMPSDRVALKRFLKRAGGD